MGVVLSLANPLDIIFWLSIGGRVLSDPGLGSKAFLVGFFVGVFLASLAVAVVAGFWQARLTSRVVQVISWTCGLGLIGFGLRLGFSTGQQLVIW
jgi:threonine/homoserine/homoserine lactone efflux protein